MTKINCAFVGNGVIGKHCLIDTFINGKYTPNYYPYPCETEIGHVEYDNQNFELFLYNAAGQDDYKKMRALFYNHAEIFIYCFNLTSHSSFESIESNWIPEIKAYKKDNVPFILVGLRSDLRDENMQNNSDYNYDSPVSTAEGFALKEKIGALDYIECSALKNERISDVFKSIVKAYIYHEQIKPVKKKKFSKFFSKEEKDKKTDLQKSDELHKIIEMQNLRIQKMESQIEQLFQLIQEKDEQINSLASQLHSHESRIEDLEKK